MGQRAANGFARPEQVATALQVPGSVLDRAVDDAVADGLVERHAEGLVLTEAGFGVFRGIMGEGFAQLRDQIETENDAPLTDEALAELRTIARRLILTEGDFSPRPSVH